MSLQSVKATGLNATIYVREQGPICYGAPAFYHEALLRSELSTELMSSDLGWSWESARNRPLVPYSDLPQLPERRPITQLTRGNISSLLDDLRERDEDGYGRAVSLFGVDPEAVLTVLEPQRMRLALEAFSAREEGPIRLVLVQIGDQNNEYVFVPHQPIAPVRTLLKEWCLDRQTVANELPYERLRSAKLESMYGLPIVRARS